MYYIQSSLKNRFIMIDLHLRNHAQFDRGTSPISYQAQNGECNAAHIFQDWFLFELMHKGLLDFYFRLNQSQEDLPKYMKQPGVNAVSKSLPCWG